MKEDKVEVLFYNLLVNVNYLKISALTATGVNQLKITDRYAYNVVTNEKEYYKDGGMKYVKALYDDAFSKFNKLITSQSNMIIKLKCEMVKDFYYSKLVISKGGHIKEINKMINRYNNLIEVKTSLDSDNVISQKFFSDFDKLINNIYYENNIFKDICNIISKIKPVDIVYMENDLFEIKNTLKPKDGDDGKKKRIMKA